MKRSVSGGLFFRAFTFTIPVLLGYLAIGLAFGLLLVDAGYPAWLAPLMSLCMYAGAGQYLAVGLFAAGASLAECVLLTLVVNARHLAYGFSMMKKVSVAGRFTPYILFAMTDETFALLSSLPEGEAAETIHGNKGIFMFIVSVLDQSYWVLGSILGALLGTVLPFNLVGLDFALTSLFIVLMIEQAKRAKRAAPFAVSAVCAVLASFLLPERLALLLSLSAALAIVAFFQEKA